MKPILYEYNERHFLTNGLGRLSGAISCEVEEARNGIDELTMVYPVTGAHYSDIREGRLVYARHDEAEDKQPFRIYHISRPINGKVTVSAHHITYDLSKITVMPCHGSSASDAFVAIEDNAASACDFEFWTDVATGAEWSVDVPSSIRSILGGTRGSILDAFGGEYEWDHRTVKLHTARGRETDVVISYGKNLTKLKYETDDSEIWTGIIPFWRGDDGNGTEVTVTLTEKIIYSRYRQNFEEDRYIPVDLSGEFEDKPTEEQLRSKAQSYVAANARSVIPASIDVSFVELWQTEEYKNFAPLERLRLCDTVTIRHKEYGIESRAKIVKTKYDVLGERYLSMTVGEVRTNLVSNLQRSIEDILEGVAQKTATKSFMKRAIDHATELLRGGLGGHVIIKTNADGEPNEILVMDTTNIETAVNVLRINLNGIGFSHHGYDGPFETAWTLDGRFYADFITAGTMLADRIRGGTLQLGGEENGNGVLIVYGDDGNEIGRWDKDGANITGNLVLKNENITAKISKVNGYITGKSGSSKYIRQTPAHALRIDGTPWDSTGQTARGRTNSFAFVASDMYQLFKETPKTALDDFVSLQGDRSIVTKSKSKEYGLLTEHSSPGQYILCNTDFSLLSNDFNGDTDYSLHYYSENPQQAFILLEDLIAICAGGIHTGQPGGATGYIGTDKGLQAKSLSTYFYISPYYGGIVGCCSDGNGGVKAYFEELGNVQFRENSHFWVYSNISVDISANMEVSGSPLIRVRRDSSASWNYVEWQSNSSRRYKHDIELISDSDLDPHRLYDLDVKQFYYNDDANLQYQDMRDLLIPGFIAEEVAEIYPAAVIHDQEDLTTVESWDERRIIPPMLALIQEQKKEIDTLKERVAELEKLVARFIDKE